MQCRLRNYKKMPQIHDKCLKTSLNKDGLALNWKQQDRKNGLRPIYLQKSLLTTLSHKTVSRSARCRFSPKMNKLICFLCFYTLHGKKTKSVCLFFGTIYDGQICLRFYLTSSKQFFNSFCLTLLLYKG